MSLIFVILSLLMIPYTIIGGCCLFYLINRNDKLCNFYADDNISVIVLDVCVFWPVRLYFNLNITLNKFSISNLLQKIKGFIIECKSSFKGFIIKYKSSFRDLS